MANKTAAQSAAEAKITGLKDSFLTVLFAALSYVAVELLTWAISYLDILDTVYSGRYAWVKPILALLLAAALKGLDRRIHEDRTNPATGLIKV